MVKLQVITRSHSQHLPSWSSTHEGRRWSLSTYFYWTSQTLWFLKYPPSLLQSNLYACEFELELSNPTVSSSLRTIPFWKCSNRILLYSLAMTNFIQSWKIASTQWLKKGVKLSQVIGWKENYNSKPSCWSI